MAFSAEEAAHATQPLRKRPAPRMPDIWRTKMGRLAEVPVRLFVYAATETGADRILYPPHQGKVLRMK